LAGRFAAGRAPRSSCWGPARRRPFCGFLQMATLGTLSRAQGAGLGRCARVRARSARRFSSDDRPGTLIRDFPGQGPWCGHLGTRSANVGPDTRRGSRWGKPVEYGPPGEHSAEAGRVRRRRRLERSSAELSTDSLAPRESWITSLDPRPAAAYRPHSATGASATGGAFSKGHRGNPGRNRPDGARPYGRPPRRTIDAGSGSRAGLAFDHRRVPWTGREVRSRRAFRTYRHCPRRTTTP
jgi:hypothetical protein